MKKRLKFWPHLLLLLLLGCASDPVHYAEFAHVDQDESGGIEWHEFKAAYPEASPKSFMEADRNKDGKITPAEWASYIKRYAP